MTLNTCSLVTCIIYACILISRVYCHSFSASVTTNLSATESTNTFTCKPGTHTRYYVTPISHTITYTLYNHIGLYNDIAMPNNLLRRQRSL